MLLPRFIAALAAFSAVASAMPHWHPRIRSTSCPLSEKSCRCKLDKAVLPTINKPGYKELTPPTSAHPIRVVLGRGTQNYTCATNTAASVPAPIGAKARLYDASCLAQKNPSRLHRLPAEIFEMDEAKVGAYIARQMPGPDRTDNPIGSHYFSDLTTPTFDFRHGDFVAAKKLENVPAPAKLGKWGTVDWLQLGAVRAGSVKYSAIYRVITAGGKAPADCSGRPRAFQVPYATEYWFYM